MIRLMDVILSSLALVMLLPILLPTALLLRFTGEGEVFFIQQRVGFQGSSFGLYKFATMLKDSPNMGTKTVTVRDDPRILPFGRILRKTKINELPQLFNILLGHMSVVGPRPLTKDEFALYEESVQTAITNVKPGLSGVQQVIIRDEEGLVDAIMASNDFYRHVLAPYKGSLEQWFVENRSVFIYLTVIVMTVWIIATPKNSGVWRVLKGLPEPPDELKVRLSYPENR